MTKGFIILYFCHFEFVSDFGVEIFFKKQESKHHHFFCLSENNDPKQATKTFTTPCACFKELNSGLDFKHLLSQAQSELLIN
jgi:hypothetical protein